MLLEFGFRAKKLSEQIKGIPKYFDRYANCINTLYNKNLLTEKETDKARNRLIKSINSYMDNKKKK
jgi:hypothetical protein